MFIDFTPFLFVSIPYLYIVLIFFKYYGIKISYARFLLNQITKPRAEAFAQEHNLTTQAVIYKLQHRQLVGKEIEGEWYVFRESEPQYRDVSRLSFPLRMLNAFFVALAGAVLLSVYSVSTTSSFEGGAGLAGMVTFLFAFPSIVIVLLFIKSVKIHKYMAIGSLLLGLFVVLIFNS